MNKIKSSSQTFFDTLGTVIMFFLKLFAKFIGLILIIIGAVTIFSLFVSLLSLSTSSVFEPWWMDYPDALNTTGMPIWLGSLTVFFFFGIPAFFVLYLGLKILINNLKSIGNVAKFSLLGLWLLSIIGLVTIGVKQTSDFALDSTVSTKHELVYNTTDTLAINMNASSLDSYKNGMYRNNGFEVKYNENDEKIIFSRNLRLTIRSTKDTIAYMQVEKESKGKDYIQAKERAQGINYNFALNNNELLLDNFLTTAYDNKFRDQNVELFLYIPEGSHIDLNSNTRSFLNHYRSSNNIVSQNHASHLLLIKEDSVDCLDCNDDDENYININDNNSKLKIDDKGVIIKSDDVNIIINEDGVKAEADDVKVNINEDGIDIRSDDN